MLSRPAQETAKFQSRLPELQMILRTCFVVFMTCLPAWVWAAEASIKLNSATLENLLQSAVGDEVTVALFPVGPGKFAAVNFERIDVLAPGAKVIVVDNGVERELPRSQRIHLIGRSADGTTWVGLSFNPDLREAPTGAGMGADGEFILRAEKAGSSWMFSGLTPAAALPPGVELKYLTNQDGILIPNNRPTAFDDFTRALVPNPSGTGPARVAVIGVDTDASLLVKRFSNDTTNASDWIADLFVQLNVVYQRDLNVVLQQGTTFLRPNSDPYPNGDADATPAQLNEFGSYWQSNYSTGPSAVNRSFALLLSGNSSSGFSASGIAWINSYCRTQSNGGSYSTNQVFTDATVPVSASNSIVAHELGHNFGADHTHCSRLSNGTGPVATGTIDQCYRGETARGYYGGTPTCPAGGVGSLMSYCNFGAPDGAACGTSQQRFHPSHISYLLTRVAANTPSCLNTNSIIFANGFD